MLRSTCAPTSRPRRLAARGRELLGVDVVADAEVADGMPIPACIDRSIPRELDHEVRHDRPVVDRLLAPPPCGEPGPCHGCASSPQYKRAPTSRLAPVTAAPSVPLTAAGPCGRSGRGAGSTGRSPGRSRSRLTACSTTTANATRRTTTLTPTYRFTQSPACSIGSTTRRRTADARSHSYIPRWAGRGSGRALRTSSSS